MDGVFLLTLPVYMVQTPVDTSLNFYSICWKTKDHDDDSEPPHRPSLHCGPLLMLHVVSEALRSAGFNSTLVKESDVKSGELHFFIWGPAGTKCQETLCKWDT